MLLENTRQTELVDRDRDLLLGLYRYRALTTNHLMTLYHFTQPYMYRKLMHLRNKGLITSGNISGYLPNQSRQGKYHRITQKGLSLLREMDYEIKHNADALRISKHRIGYLLTTYDLMIALEPYGWKVLESRETKKNLGISNRTGIQGMLISPNGDNYPFYIFINPIKTLQMGKVLDELRNINFGNLILFVKTKEALDQITEVVGNRTDIARFNSFRVFPYLYSVSYLRAFDYEENLINYLEKDYGIKFRYSDEQNRHGLKTVVEHDSEQKYLVNLLDQDLTKFYKIKSYRKEDYERDGKRLLVVTNNRIINDHKEELANIRHIDYLKLNYDKMLDYLSSVPLHSHSFSENSNNNG